MSKTIEQYMPEGTPEYMFEAWVSCLKWAAKNPEIQRVFQRNYGDIEANLVIFIRWFNENIWGLEEL